MILERQPALRDGAAGSELVTGTGTAIETRTGTSPETVIVTGGAAPAPAPARLSSAQPPPPAKNMKNGNWKKCGSGRRKPRLTWRLRRTPKPRVSPSLV